MLKRWITKFRLWRWDRENLHILELAYVRQAQRYACTGSYNPNLDAVIEKLRAQRAKISS